jgi:ABC-type nickel/cobalt efflux system permease component RcnA
MINDNIFGILMSRASVVMKGSITISGIFVKLSAASKRNFCGPAHFWVANKASPHTHAHTHNTHTHTHNAHTHTHTPNLVRVHGSDALR